MLQEDMDQIKILEIENMPQSFYVTYIRPCVAEFIGVMFFVLIGCATLQNTPPNLLYVALAHGLTIALLIIIFGKVSGGHFNPAVTLGVTLAGGLQPILAGPYILAQLTGGILGAGCARGMINSTVYEMGNGGGQTIATNTTPGTAFFCEMMLTCLLVLTVIMSAVDQYSGSALAPIAIGLTVAVDICAGGLVSGASMNPARSFGPAIALSYHSTVLWTYHWVYWVGPLCGSLMAAFLYRVFLASDDKRIIKYIQ